MRVTDRTLIDTVTANLNANTNRMMKVERELSSGRKLNSASDDPSAVALAMRYRTDIGQSEQYSRLVDSGRSRLSAADTALGSLTDVLQRARELTVQSGASTISSDQLKAMATEINQLIHHAVQIGNTNFAGQYLFAGTRTTTAPLTAVGDTPPSVTYNGNANPITLDLGQTSQIQVDAPGDQSFVPAINALIQIRDALNLGDRTTATQTGLSAIDASMDGLLQVRGSIGARVNRLDSLGNRLGDERTNLQEVQSQLEDIDVAEVVVRLNSARNVYEAALGAAAKAVQPSLVEFLR